MDYGFTLKHDLEQILDMNLPTRLDTNSKRLFDVITKNSTTTDKRLIIDIQPIREAYLCMEIHDIDWIRSEHNPADALTKVKENPILNAILEEGAINYPVQQRMIRNIA